MITSKEEILNHRMEVMAQNLIFDLYANEVIY